MDKLTIEAYNQEAENIAQLHDNLVPERLYQLIVKYFCPGMKTLDIGCGNGRDSAWLSKNGFEVIGLDASLGMLRQAKKRHPKTHFLQAALPELSGIPDATFSNALCSAVLMHMERSELQLATKSILRVLTKGAVLLVSIRGTLEANKRENGKLYEAITPEEMMALFEHEGAKLLFYESTLEAVRNHIWHTLIFRK
jgi:ubiquinone/menaquinone biosynthesis C-methylase UbiE